ncbi:streptophobe family protein [Streptomyces minutiscleroticus]|uniref:streptophobe family protein n=1 Tax=Streptomyces minutiscleroticus TaxID=68238 RepID=UPI003326D241
MSDETASRGRRIPWGDVLLTAIAAVSWALIGMAGTAALGLHLLDADAAGALGPMAAAVVALGAGGSVTPSGDLSAFGLSDMEAATALRITPLGVGLVGALLLSAFFLRSLRGAGAVVAPAELAARACAVAGLFVATLGGLARAGHDVITFDGAALGLDGAAGPGGGSGLTGDLPGGLGDIGGVGDIGGLLPDRLGELADAKATVGFTVDLVPTLLGGLVWVAGVLVVALLASRRTPLPRGWDAVHRVVRPAASALVTAVLVAVVAALAAAAYAAIGDAHPRRVVGAALLGAPNGAWLGVPLGLLVPWDGRATGTLGALLPDPLDDLLRAGAERPVTVGRLAELDGRVWLLAAAAALTMLYAGVLTAVRTPFVRAARTRDAGYPLGRDAGGPYAGGADLYARGDLHARGGGAPPGAAGARGDGPLGFAGRCALRLGVLTALTLPLLVRLTDVSATASLSVLGFDAFGAGLDLHGHPGAALLLGAVWGAGAGAAGALLAYACGAAGRRAAPAARGGTRGGPGAVPGDTGTAVLHAGAQGRAAPGPGAVPGDTGTEILPAGAPGRAAPGPGAPVPGPGIPRTGGAGAGIPGGAGQAPGAADTPVAGASVPNASVPNASVPGPAPSGGAGPYRPTTPYRPVNPDTNPYLRLPEGLRPPQVPPPEPEEPEEAEEPEDARPPEAPGRPGEGRPPDVHGAPTVAGPLTPPRTPRPRPRPKPPPPPSGEGPPPPGTPRGRR